MNLTSIVQDARRVKDVFKVLATIHLTSFLWPQQAVIQDGASFDFIVVGAGSAGSVIASRLSEIDTATVLLIEAGGDPPVESVYPSMFLYLKKTKYDWDYISEKDKYAQKFHKNYSLDLTSGKMLGGTSSINYMAYTRGNPHDFDNWARITGDSSWRWNNVLPYFRKSEKLDDPITLNSADGYLHGTNGYMKVSKYYNDEVIQYFQAFEEVGNNIVLDINGVSNIGYTECMFTIADGARQSTAYSFLIPAKLRPNLFVIKNSLVSKILFDEYKTAIGVEVILQNNTTVTFYANKEVIISAGTIHTAQLLMLSGIGPANHLQNIGINVVSDLPVGEKIQDHVMVLLAQTMGKSTPLKPIDPTRFPFPLIHGFASLNKSKSYPDYQVFSFILSNSEPMLQFCTLYYSYKDKICQALYEGTEGYGVFLSTVVLLHTESRGKVLLKSNDPKDKPLIYMGYYSNYNDLDNHAKYIQDFLRVRNTNLFKSANSKLVVPEICGCGSQNTNVDFWKCYALCMMASGYHYVGTCPMGSVVDSDLRVYGVQNLRVADASVMPSITGGNTNAPTIMIGEKISDIIKFDYYSNNYPF